MTAPIVPGELVTLSPLVQRVTENNPGIYTGSGTNTHLVGDTSLIILDPGEDRDDGHFDRLVNAVGSRRVTAIVPSHGHPDHWPLAPRLSRHFEAPTWFFERTTDFPVDRTLADGEVLRAGTAELTVLHTPGHTRDHLSFHLPVERALFPGDSVMGWSSSIIAPPDGDLTDYLASLRRMAAIADLGVLYPAHGGPVTSPYERIEALRAHREMRTRQAISALGAGPATVADLVTVVYRGTDPALYPAAAQSLLAHLLALESAGSVTRDDRAEPLDRAVWRLAD